jgi:hypothetical protein
MIQDLALWQIETELAELLTAREAMEEEGALPEELAAIDGQIAAYCSAEVAKVDRIAGAIRACEVNANVLAEEIDRLESRKKAWEDRAERIMAATLAAMQARGIKSLETPANRLTVAGNGGVEPLEFTGGPLPAQLCTVLVKMPLATWRRLGELTDHDCVAGEPGPNTAAIRAALKRGENVPGAKLGERGVHLRMK